MVMSALILIKVVINSGEQKKQKTEKGLLDKNCCTRNMKFFFYNFLKNTKKNINEN